MKQEVCVYGAPAGQVALAPHGGIRWLWLSHGALEVQIGGTLHALSPGEMVLCSALQPCIMGNTGDDAACLHFETSLQGAFELRLPPVWREHVFSRGVIFLRSGDPCHRIRELASRWQAELGCFQGAERELVLDEISVVIRRAMLMCGYPQARLVRAGHDPRQMRRVMRMLEYMGRAYRDPIAVDDVARVAGLHRATAMTQFKKVVGVSINQYLTALRIHEARKLLLTSAAPVTEIAYASGFSSLSRFYDVFSRTFGEKPQSYRRICGAHV